MVAAKDQSASLRRVLLPYHLYVLEEHMSDKSEEFSLEDIAGQPIYHY